MLRARYVLVTWRLIGIRVTDGDCDGARQADQESDRIGATGTKTVVVQYTNAEGRTRRVKLGRFGVLTVDRARDLAKIKLGQVAAGEDPAEDARTSKKAPTVSDLCDWYLTEARSGRILGRRNLPIKTSSLDMDQSRIRAHIKPLLGKRAVRSLTIADVEDMQTNVLLGKTAKPRDGGRGGHARGGPGVAARCVGTLQAILGHAQHKGLIAEHPARGARKLPARSAPGASAPKRSS